MKEEFLCLLTVGASERARTDTRAFRTLGSASTCVIGILLLLLLLLLFWCIVLSILLGCHIPFCSACPWSSCEGEVGWDGTGVGPGGDGDGDLSRTGEAVPLPGREEDGILCPWWLDASSPPTFCPMLLMMLFPPPLLLLLLLFIVWVPGDWKDLEGLVPAREFSSVVAGAGSCCTGACTSSPSRLQKNLMYLSLVI